jgi:excisionase family DNA binding protein
MSSNIRVNKICQYCGKEFIAQKTTTKYCSHKCASRAYKDRQREGKIKASLVETIQIKESEFEELRSKDYLSISETSKLLGISRRTIYRMIKRGDLNVGKIGRRTIIRRSDIEKIFDKPQPQQKVKDKKQEYDFNLTISEAYKKFGVSEKAFYEFCKRNNIPKQQKGKYVYVPESLIKQLWQ